MEQASQSAGSRHPLLAEDHQRKVEGEREDASGKVFLEGWWEVVEK